MLRITPVLDSGSPAVLKLEGKLLEPWVGVLQDACRRARQAAAAVEIDLSAVSYVDRPSTIALRELSRRGIAIRGCSPLVAELLKENV